MAQPFTCSICGVTQTRRSHFAWLVALVGFLHGHVLVGDGPVCVRCAPRWATGFGSFLYALIAIGLALAVWKFAFASGVPR